MAPRTSSSARGGKKKDTKLSKTFVVGPFRMAFPALLEPEETDNGDRYKVTMLFEPGSPDIAKIDAALYDCMEDYFGPEADWPTGKNDAMPEDKFYDAGKKDYTGFKKGWMAITASSVDAPGVIGPDKADVLNKREVYGGRWARAEITITTYDNKSKGVTAYLNHVQLLDHDEAFSGKGNAEDKFDAYEMKDRGRGGRDDDDDRGSRRGRGRDDEDEDRGSRRGSGSDRGRGRDRDDDDRDDRSSSRGRSRDDEDEGRSRGRDRDEGRRSRDDRSDDNRRGSGRDRDDDERPSRGRSREDEDERPSRSEGRGRDRDNDREERSSSRSRDSGRDDRDDRDDRRGSSRSGRDTSDGWN